MGSKANGAIVSNNNPQTNGTTVNRFTQVFAIILISLSGVILIILLIMGWHYIAPSVKPDKTIDNSSFNNIKELFNILLPVIGTWMGTLLAFYFSKDNFAAANQQVKDLTDRITGTDQKLQLQKVSDVMIKVKDGMLLTLADEAAFKASQLDVLRKKMVETQTERLPILETGTLKFIFLIYRTTIDRFILGALEGTIHIPNKQITPQNKQNLTVQDMYDSDDPLFKQIQGVKYCFLPANATLDKAKEAMQDNTICQDVFITQNGTNDEPVLGWITNTLVIEKAELFKKAGQ